MTKIICVGSASKDIFFPTEEGLLMETPEDITAQKKVAFEVGAKYQIEDRFEAVGGVAANCAQGLVRLGQAASCYSCVGNDQVGDWVLAQLKNEGVGVELIEQKEGAQTDLSAILVLMQNGERTIFFNRDANELLQVKDEKLLDAEWIFVSALNGDWKTNMHTILETVKEKGLRLAVNPGQRNMKDDVSVVLEAVRNADVLLVNKDEAIDLVLGMQTSLLDETLRATLQDEIFLVKALHEYGAKTVALTDGVRGAWGYAGIDVMMVEVVKQKAVDATGSGDAFGSGFLAAWSEGLGLKAALQWGIVNGGSVVQFYGANKGLLHRDALESVSQVALVKVVG